MAQVAEFPFDSVFPLNHDSSSTWTINHMKYSGLSESESITIYKREEAIRLWNELNNLEVKVSPAKKDLLFVAGCPGIGKSTEVYGWAVMQAKLKSVLWVHYSLAGVFCARLFPENGCVKVKHFSINSRDLNALESAVEQFFSDIVILDGFSGENCKTLLGTGMNCCSILVWCSSFAFSSTLKPAEKAGIRHFWDDKECILDTWCYDDLRNVFDTGIFGDSVPTLDILKEKHYYIGDGGIRLYFCELNKAIYDIDQHFSRVNNFNDLLGGLVGDSAKVAVHSLMQYRKVCWGQSAAVSGPVSKYITLKLVDKVGLTFVNSAKSIMMDNPSFQGWIFELEVIWAIKNCANCFGDRWICGTTGRFVQVFDANGIPTDIAENTWIIPTKYNQGGFDILYYKSKGDMEAVQITRAKKHVYKLKYLAPFVDAVKNGDGKCSVLFIVVIPKENANSFGFTVKHFKNLCALSKYDDKWISTADLNDFALLTMFSKGIFSESKLTDMLLSLNVDENSGSSSSDISANKKRKIYSPVDDEEEEEEEEDDDDI